MAKGDIKPQYDVCRGDSIQDLRIQVQLHMQGGWRPQGGVAFQGGTMYLQAMVRHLEEVGTSDILYKDLHHCI